jgi:hypothetical protein
LKVYIYFYDNKKWPIVKSQWAFIFSLGYA